VSPAGVYGLTMFLLGLAAGGCAGAVLLARWWTDKMRDPAFARKALAEIHQTAHPHWLQVAEDDSTPVCPCCGWSPKEKENRP
jgi:hypothetical protein